MSLRLPPPLLALSPGTLKPGEVQAFLVRAGEAVHAGLRGILLREAHLPDRLYLEFAQPLARMLEEVGGWLGLHDRPHLVATVGAHGVHLGFRSLPPRTVRDLVEAQVAVGCSTHAGDGTDQWAGSDYLFHGPVFQTPSKAGLVLPTEAQGLSVFADQAGLPVWGLGGITPERVAAVLGAGAAGVACLDGILAQPDPAARSRAYLEQVSR